MGAVVRLGAAYANLTADQLREMLGAARATHHREILGMKERWAAEVSALRQAMTRSLAQSTAQLQEQKNVIASLRRELDVVYAELFAVRDGGSDSRSRRRKRLNGARV